MSVSGGVISSFLEFLRSLSNPQIKASISFQDMSLLNTIKGILNDLPLLNDLYNNYATNTKTYKNSYLKLTFRRKTPQDLTKFNNIESELEELEKKALQNIILARETFDNMRVMAVNSDINNETFLKIIKSCSEICFKSQHFSILVLDEEDNKQVYYSTVKFFEVLSKDALGLITKVVSNDEIYQNSLYSAKEFCKLDVLKQLGEHKTVCEVEIQLKKAEINQIYLRTYKKKRLLLFLDDKNSNKFELNDNKEVFLVMKLGYFLYQITRNEVISKTQLCLIIEYFKAAYKFSSKTEWANSFEIFFDSKISFYWPRSKEFEEYKEFILKEKKSLLTSDKKVIFPLKDSSKGIFCFIAFRDFPYNIFAFKSKVRLFYEKYLHFLTSEIQEKTSLDIIDKAYNNSVLVLVFDKNNHLIYQNREIPANLKWTINTSAFNFPHFEPKKIGLDEIFSNNPAFIAKLEKEKEKLKSSFMDNFASFDGKPNFDLILKKNKHGKVVEYILVIQNEKNLIVESAEYNKKRTVSGFQTTKTDKYIAYFVKNFHLKNSITGQELMRLLQKNDKELDIKTPLKKFLEELNKNNMKEDLSFLNDYSTIDSNFLSSISILKRKNKDSVTSKRMSLSIAFQEASKQTQHKTASPQTRKQLPHSKTFVGQMTSQNPPQKTGEIDAIGETEENLTESDDLESQNTFVFDNDRSHVRLSTDALVAPMSKDFVTQDKDYENLDNWNFDIISVRNLMEKYRLIGTMFNSLGYLERFEIELPVFGKFLLALQEKYNIRNNPFHNFDHGFTVCHGTFWIIKNKLLYDYFDEIDCFALLFSALCHDVDHTGRTNGFEVASYSNLALKHNDESVLENHHCSLTFKILCQQNCNILANTTENTFKYIRKMVIYNILSTDMKKHFEILKEFEVQSKEMKENLDLMKNENSKKLLSGAVIHGADLYSATKYYPIMRSWSDRVNQEFLNQTADEERLGIPVTAYMKELDKEGNRAKSEIGFIKIIAKPIWTTLNVFFDGKLDEQCKNIEENMKMWENILEKWNSGQK